VPGVAGLAAPAAFALARRWRGFGRLDDVGGGGFGGGGGVLAGTGELGLELGELSLELPQLSAEVIDLRLKALAVGAGGGGWGTHGPCFTLWQPNGTPRAMEPTQRSSPSTTGAQGVNRYPATEDCKSAPLGSAPAFPPSRPV